jgi:hypothetical protein
MTLNPSITPSTEELLTTLAESGIVLRVDEIEEYGVINAVEAAIHRSGKAIDCPVTHSFTPGHYFRQITMPAGAIVVSNRHKTWHPYTITKGNVSAIEESAGDIRILHVAVAPGEHFASVTPPDTRRLLVCREETVWSTLHPTELTDVDAIMASILLPNSNPLLLQ